MTKSALSEMEVAGENRLLNVRSDPPDIRDRMYEPALIQLRPEMDNRRADLVLNQHSEGACTGFGLAAVINLLSNRRDPDFLRVSTRMLYEMAKKHDEWPGENYDGSSCRGAIRGWKNMGVCSDALWPYLPPDDRLTIERARAARHNALGAYYRLRPEISDYHAALNETGAIYVSATVHEGWWQPVADADGGIPHIAAGQPPSGGHAFAIVGYNRDGFIVQNSWGAGWGQDGFAMWLYEDWLENIMDGWVFRLGLPVPQIFGLTAGSTEIARGVEAERKPPPKRSEIAGHFVHFENGRYKQKGDYWSTTEDIHQTAQQIAANDKYGHLLIYAHGGLNAPKASARRIRALKDGFTRNGVYPFHIMYDTGLAETLKDVAKQALGFVEERAGGFVDWWDNLIEDAVRKPVTPLWKEMKRDALLPFVELTDGQDGDGIDTINAFAAALNGTGKSIHLAGHSTGGVLMGHLLKALDKLEITDVIRTCSLMAPACTTEFYDEYYRPRLGKGGDAVVKLPKMTVYNLTDELEKDDNVAYAYRKSLLYLVSRALERQREMPLLGMQKYSTKLSAKPGLKFVYSDGRSGRSTSRSHGGFDNDAPTMNDILATVLGAPPPQPFTPEELEY